MKALGYGLMAVGVIGIVYAFATPKGEYGTPEYRKKQPLGAKILVASTLVGGVGYLILKSKK